MSLVTRSMTDFVFMSKTSVSDGEGGRTTSWVEGSKFMAVAVINSSAPGNIAEHSDIVRTYTISVPSGVSLKFHDVVKRKSDGAVFRITSASADKTAPSCSTLGFAQATAERWVLT